MKKFLFSLALALSLGVVAPQTVAAKSTWHDVKYLVQELLHHKQLLLKVAPRLK